MFVGKSQVQTCAEEMSAIRITKCAAQRTRRWQIGLRHREQLELVHMLVVSEEEEAVLDNWAADPDAGVAPHEECIRRPGIQKRVCGHVVIAEEKVPRTVIFVAA